MSYDYQNFTLSVDERGVAVFTVNRPEKMNAMNDTSWRELGDFFSKVDDDPQIRVVILTGAGEQAFIAGADITVLATRTAITSLASQGYKRVSLIETCSKPVIAAVNGYAFGGGLEVALACDFRVCSDNAMFALPETGLGVIPGAGGTQRLSRLVGMSRAKELIMLGRRIKAAEAVQWGLVTKSVPQAELMAEAQKMADRLLEKGPVALDIAKRLVRASLSSSEDLGLVMENLGYSICCASEDKNEGMNSFIEKRKPNYKGR